MKIKMLNRKGIFFTFISITLMATLIIIFTPTASVNIGSDASVVKTRVTTVNNFVYALENSYFESILKVSSHKAINALVSYVNANGFFADLAEVKSKFSEVAANGTINNIPQPEMIGGNTIKNWTDRMANVSKNTLNINSEFTVNEVNISQSRPWLVDLRMNISFSVSSETASWDISGFIVNAELSIQGFNDSYYFVNTGGAYINQINKTNTTFDKWDRDKVRYHIGNATYVHFENSEAPTFLQRFTNDFSDIEQKNCCGIESLVNPNKLDDLGINQKYASYADYMFAWSATPDCNSADPSLYTITGISDAGYSGFKLDFNHVVNYKLTDYDTLICPPPT